MKHFLKPEYPEKFFYIEYWYNGGYGREILEFWCDTKEEYEGKLLNLRRHARYGVIKQRYPKRRG